MEDKICKVCVRSITWRKKWEKNWDSILYCSDACRRSKSSLKLPHEESILSLLTSKTRDACVCPLDILPPEDRKDTLKVEKVREAARRLAAAGKIDIMQNGNVVNPSTAKGLILVRLKNRIV